MQFPTTIRFKKPWRIYPHITLRTGLITTILIAILLITLNKTYELTQYTFLAYAHIPQSTQMKDRSLPTFVHIPSLEVSLPIDEVSNTTLFWKTNSDSASHLAASALPGESDNIVLYGRNTPESFERLTSLRKGDTIIINSKNGDSHEYIVTQLTIALPTEVDQISSTDEETLTLYTSYGFGGLKRFVVKSLPISD